MFTLYSSVCNLFYPQIKQKPNEEKTPKKKYIISKNEANETIILEYMNEPKYKTKY